MTADPLFQMTMTNVYKIVNCGTFIEGQIENGTIKINDEIFIECQSGNIKIKVRGLQRSKKPVVEAKTGDIVVVQFFTSAAIGINIGDKLVGLVDEFRDSAHIRQCMISENKAEFTSDQRTALEKKGYLIYHLTGQTIETLLYNGKSILSAFRGDSIEQLQSMLTEVAIDPKNLFLPNSNNERMDVQTARVKQFGEKLEKEIPGVTAIIGHAPDYVELTFLHLASTSKNLFGKDHNFLYTCTTTPTNAVNRLVVVGNFHDFGCLGITNSDATSPSENVWVAPLVVPSTLRFTNQLMPIGKDELMLKRSQEFLGKQGFEFLRVELERQAVIYSDLGICKDAIMKLLSPRPSQLPEELSIPVVTLGTSIALDTQINHAGIKKDPRVDLSLVEDYAGGVTYDQPHLIWMQDGKKYKNKYVNWAIKHPNEYERPATLADGIAFAMVNLDFFGVIRDHVLEFPGSQGPTSEEVILDTYRICLHKPFLFRDPDRPDRPILLDWNPNHYLTFAYYRDLPATCGS